MYKMPYYNGDAKLFNTDACPRVPVGVLKEDIVD